MTMASESFGEKFGDAMRRLLSCCDREDEEPARPALQISGPTNFRREDISIPGLDEEQQQFIRTKAITDARKMWAHLQPLRSSPSGQFASPTNPSPIRVSYEEFTIPRPAPQPSPTLAGHRRTTSGQRLAENLRSHGRRVSASLRGSGGGGAQGGYQPVNGGSGVVREDSKYEMQMSGAGQGKMIGESDSVGGSEFGGGKI